MDCSDSERSRLNKKLKLFVLVVDFLLIVFFVSSYVETMPVSIAIPEDLVYKERVIPDEDNAFVEMKENVGEIRRQFGFLRGLERFSKDYIDSFWATDLEGHTHFGWTIEQFLHYDQSVGLKDIRKALVEKKFCVESVFVDEWRKNSSGDEMPLSFFFLMRWRP